MESAKPNILPSMHDVYRQRLLKVAALKVLIASDSYPPRPDGIAQSTAGLRQGLDELGHEVTLVVPDGTAAEAATTRLHMVRTAPFKIASYPVTLSTQGTFG